MSYFENAPGMPVALEETGDVIINDDGEPEQAVDATFRQEDIEKMRGGYKCLRCWEDHPNAWPDKCRVCGYRMADFQSQDFARHYGGEKWIGPSTSMQEELDRLDYEDEKRQWERKGSSGIIIPRAHAEGADL